VKPHPVSPVRWFVNRKAFPAEDADVPELGMVVAFAGVGVIKRVTPVGIGASRTSRWCWIRWSSMYRLAPRSENYGPSESATTTPSATATSRRSAGFHVD